MANEGGMLAEPTMRMRNAAPPMTPALTRQVVSDSSDGADRSHADRSS